MGREAMGNAELSAACLHPQASLSLAVTCCQGQVERLEPAHQLLLALLQQISSSGVQADPTPQFPALHLYSPHVAAEAATAGFAAAMAAETAGRTLKAAAAVTPVPSPGSVPPPEPRTRRADSAPAAAGRRKRGRAEAELDEERASQQAEGQREAVSVPASPSQQAASPLLFHELWKQMKLPPDVVRSLSAPPSRLDSALLQQSLAGQQQLQDADDSQKTDKEILALSLAFEAYRRMYEHKRVYGATPLLLPSNVVKLLARSILERRQ